MPNTLSRFFRQLSAYRGARVFNPWADHDPSTDTQIDAPAQRLRRLRQHFDIDAKLILIGEAPGYQGCHVTGIPFTSERLILEGMIPRIAAPATRLSTRPRPWSEPSATTVWGILLELGVADRTLLWNAFPWHPHQPRNRQSNRTPTHIERSHGLPLLTALLNAFPNATTFAVGRQAEASLRELGTKTRYLRHPSMAGAAAFRRGLRLAIRR